MARRTLPALLGLAALLADLAGAHELALVTLLAAIPAAFALMLDCFADLLHARCSRLRPLAAAGGLVLLVLSATLRSPAVVGGVPRVAVSAIVLSLALYGAIATRAVLFGARSPSRRRPARSSSEAQPERLAA